MSQNFLVSFPSGTLVGGNIKLIHYINHLKKNNFNVKCIIQNGDNPSKIKSLLSKDIIFLNNIDDYVLNNLEFNILFSQPTCYFNLQKKIKKNNKIKFFQIVQNIRHAKAYYLDGFALNLLFKKNIIRLAINKIVHNSIMNYCDSASLFTILYSHELKNNLEIGKKKNIQNLRLKFINNNLTFCIPKWKNYEFIDFEKLKLYGKINFLEKNINKDQISKVLSKSDIFIGTPLADEGFYLPNLEAMATRCLVMSPNTSGTNEYLNNTNYINYKFQSNSDLLEKIRIFIYSLLSYDKKFINIINNGYETAKKYNCVNEEKSFINHIEENL